MYASHACTCMSTRSCRIRPPLVPVCRPSRRACFHLSRLRRPVMPRTRSPIKACLFPSLEAAPPCHAKNTPYVLLCARLNTTRAREGESSGGAGGGRDYEVASRGCTQGHGEAGVAQPDEYKPNRVRPFVMIMEIHTVILPLLVCDITSID